MGNLYIISTPIGNLEDISIRAIKILLTVPIVACEDTRRTGQLIGLLESQFTEGSLSIEGFAAIKSRKLISYFDEIEESKNYQIIDLLMEGSDVALVSDSGTPLISDPGFKLVRESIKRDIAVIPIPGPSSVLASLVASGLPTDQFIFLGYLPSGKTKRLLLFNEVFNRLISKILHPTIIFFESPHRLIDTLSELNGINPEIRIAVAREITKLYEEIFSGTVSQALNYFKKPKGEFVILLSLET